MPIHFFPTMKPKDPRRVESVGKQMYLFRYLSGSFANKLILSAHGGIQRNNPPQFTVPENLTLYFYSAHGVEANASSIETARLNDQHTEAVTRGQSCFNYSLCKFQGEHQYENASADRGETYSAIQRYQDNLPGMRRAYKDAKSSGQQVAMRGYEGGLKDFDVLTIRNRDESNGINLEQAITAARRLHPYREIHCCFCRSFAA